MSLLKNLFTSSGLTNKGKMVHIKQAHTGNDGLACIAMILNFHGIITNLTELNKQYPDCVLGISLRRIIEIFHTKGMSTRPLQCPVSELSNIKLPAILHWDMKQFVVLSCIDNNQFTIFDPTSKKWVYNQDDFEQHYAEIILEAC